jgi:hypothetical protein
MADINTVVNAFHYRAVSLMSQIAEALGETADASQYAVCAEKVKDTINSRLFDSGKGIYVDGEGVDHSALHANMMPLALGLTPDAHKKNVIDFIKSRGMACSVYGAQFLLEALYLADEDEYALELMTARHDRSWWNMLAAGSTITLEAWDWKYKNNLDWNHAWGAAPGNIIPRFLLGVRPLEPGFKRVLIQPQPGRLTHAEGRVPTIRGAIDVAVRNYPGKAFELDVTIPGNTTAEVHVPASSGDKVTVSTEPDTKTPTVTFLRMEESRAVYEIAPGNYRFVSAE